MIYSSLSNKELVRHVDNEPNATPLERELAKRMDELRVEVEMLQSMVPACGYSTLEDTDAR